MDLLDWYSAGISKCNASKTLFSNNDFHNSVYIGGYGVEILFKIYLLLHTNYVENDLRVHLNGMKKIHNVKHYNFLKVELDKLYFFYPELFDGIDLNSFPFLFSGDLPNNPTNKNWDPNYRYEYLAWTDSTFAYNIQSEVSTAYTYLENLKLGGYLR